MDCTYLLDKIGYTDNFIEKIVLLESYEILSNNITSSYQNILSMNRYGGFFW